MAHAFDCRESTEIYFFKKLFVEAECDLSFLHTPT